MPDNAESVAEQVAHEIGLDYGGNPSDYMMAKGIAAAAIERYIELIAELNDGSK